MTSSYRDLIVWQRAVQLAIAVYRLTATFPKEEKFGLISQMQRAAVSIASNIAEGRYRGTKNDFLQFLRSRMALGLNLRHKSLSLNNSIRRVSWTTLKSTKISMK